jgi:cytosine/adenosine deaminase-related metal-dependent hydrolase
MHQNRSRNLAIISTRRTSAPSCRSLLWLRYCRRILALQPVIATKVLGLDATGTLAPGMAADIALYALGDPRYFGLHDVAVGPVASGGRPGLKGLWVNGQRVVENDVLRGVDVRELRGEARGAVRRLMAG